MEEKESREGDQKKKKLYNKKNVLESFLEKKL